MRWMLAIPLIALALAGCLDTDGTGTDGPQPVDKIPVHGQVMTEALVPIPDAIVTMHNPGAVLDDGTVLKSLVIMEATTDGEGRFRFDSYPGNHLLRVEGFGLEPHEETVPVPGPNLTIRVRVQAPDGPVAYVEQTPFDGYIECALEALIITPSCDTILTETPVDPVFRDESIFSIEMDDGWKTVVLDISFDAADHPGIAGMRVSAYAPDANAEVFSYERITQAWSDGPFTLRLEPGLDYGDAVSSPVDAGGLRFEFYGHGHAGDESPALGVGATQALAFEAIASVFYHEAAPADWTLLTA